jgi:predicted Rdx family selenoprotein
MHGRTLLVAFILSIAPVAVAAAAEKTSPEENILKRAGVPVDADGLLTFFRGRTLSDTECKQIGKLIHQLGADNFDDRESASKALQKIGGRATPLLRAAKHSLDVEIAKRAGQLLKEIAAPAPLSAVAAAKLLVRRAPTDAVAVLLAYLPFAADGAVEDEVLTALLALTPDGKADPALTAALTDPLPIKRGAAAYVLGRKGDKAGNDAVRKLLTDADATVRWQAACALLTVHDKAAIPVLMELLADGPFDAAWRSEEVLHRLAGDKVTAIWLDDSPKQRSKVRDAWAAWWKDKGAGFDLTGYKEAPRPLGYTLGVEYNTGRVWECDIDGSIRWEIKDLAGPMDAQVLPNGNVLIAEADAHRVTERDLKGTVKWEKKVDGEPNGCKRLANGNTFVSTCKFIRSVREIGALEFGIDGATLFNVRNASGNFSDAICKGRDGRTFFISDGVFIQQDAAGKRLGTILLSWGQKVHYVGLQDLPGGRFLLADLVGGQVLEIKETEEVPDMLELSDKLRESLSHAGPFAKILWQTHVPGACGVMRLTNGHTLVSANHKVVELNAEGVLIWEVAAEGYVRRAYRR